jgi:hypothetical protein
MSGEIQTRVSVTTQPTFWELLLGSLTAIRYQRWLMLVHAIFPLAGLFVLMTPLLGYRLGVKECMIAILSFLFTPLITAFAIWSARRRNKLVEGPFTYTFDAEGMHTSGSAFEQMIRWSAIPRIRLSKRFLFIFLAPARAHCIPLRSLSMPEDLNHLRSLARGRTDFE